MIAEFKIDRHRCPSRVPWQDCQTCVVFLPGDWPGSKSTLGRNRQGMAVFYKGIGAGTHWSGVDLRSRGLVPRNPGATPGLNSLMEHIADGTTYSCYISLTRSFGVARTYAFSGTVVPSNMNPGYIWEIELDHPLPGGLAVIDPLAEIARHISDPLARYSYQHDGDQDFLLGVVNPRTMGAYLAQNAHDPPGSTRLPRQAHLSKELETLVRVLRDAEVLVAGNLPGASFRNRYVVY